MKPNPFAILSAFALAAVALGGCVERKITIASDPPGALVYVNDREMGRTPVTFPFLWYGDYDVRLRLDKNVGTLDEPKVLQYSYHGSRTASAPVYQWLGVDLFAELMPVRFVDEKVWAVTLQPAAQPSDDQMIQSGKDLQNRLNTDPDLKRPVEVKGATASGARTQPAASQPASTQNK